MIGDVVAWCNGAPAPAPDPLLWRLACIGPTKPDHCKHRLGTLDARIPSRCQPCYSVAPLVCAS